MERINHNHLFYFYIVAREGSIKSASELLYVSQPTISDQIKLLEEYFNFQLFVRKNRKLKISDSGKLVYEYADKIFQLSDDLNKRARHGLILPKKTIDIGMTSYMYDYFRPDDLGKVFALREHKINFHEDRKSHLLLKLEEGIIDVIFTDSKDAINSAYKIYPWGTNKTFAVAHKSFIKKGLKFPESMIGLPFFHYSQNQSLRYDIELFFSRNEIPVEVVGEGDDISLLSHVLFKKIAFVIVPEFIKDFLRKSNPDIAVLGELKSLENRVYAITKPDYEGPLLELLKNK